MKKDLFIGMCIAIPVVFLMIFIGGVGHLDFEFEKEYGKINMNPELPNVKY